MGRGDGYIPGTAGANLADYSNRFVRLDLTTRTWMLAGADTEDGILVSQVRDNSLSSLNMPITILVQGQGVVEAGGTIQEGDWLVSDANGRAVVATSGTVSNVKAREAGTSGNPVNVYCEFAAMGYTVP